MAPARDLWPQIQSRLGSRRRSWKVPMSLAASLLLVVLGFVIGNRYRPRETLRSRCSNQARTSSPRSRPIRTTSASAGAAERIARKA